MKPAPDTCFGISSWKARTRRAIRTRFARTSSGTDRSSRRGRPTPSRRARRNCTSGAKPAACAARAAMISRSRKTWWNGKSLPKRTTCLPFASATRKLSLLRPPFSGSIEIAPFQSGSARMRFSVALTSPLLRPNLRSRASTENPLIADRELLRSAGSRIARPMSNVPERHCQRDFVGFSAFAPVLVYDAFRQCTREKQADSAVCQRHSKSATIFGQIRYETDRGRDTEGQIGPVRRGARGE